MDTSSAAKTTSTTAAPPSDGESLPQALERWRLRVERELDAWLPPATAVPDRLHAAQRYSVLGPGKRIRPALVYATAETLGCRWSQVDAAACAVELIHSYSLVHDDLPAMDDDDLRRGRPTCHKRSTRRRPSSPAIRCRCWRSTCWLRSPVRRPTPPSACASSDTLAAASGTAAWPAGRPSTSRPKAAADAGRPRAAARAQDRGADPGQRDDGGALPPGLDAPGSGPQRLRRLRRAGLPGPGRHPGRRGRREVSASRRQRRGPRQCPRIRPCGTGSGPGPGGRAPCEASRQLAAHGWQDSPLAALSHWLLTRNR